MPIEFDPSAVEPPVPAVIDPNVEAPVPVEAGETADVEAPVDVLSTFSAKDIADLAVKDPDNFNFVEMLKSRPDLQSNPEQMAKMTDAFKQIRQAPFFKTLPGPKKIGETVKSVIHGGWESFKNLTTAMGEAGALGLVKGGFIGGVSPEVQDEAARDIQKRMVETWSAAEGGLTGIVRQGAKIVESPTGRAVEALARPTLASVFRLAGGKPVLDIHKETTQESELKLQEALAQAAQSEEITKGHGALMKAVGSEVVKNLEASGQAPDPAKVAEMEAAEPFSWYTFGKALAPVHMAGQAAARALPGLDTIVGRTLQGTGAAAKPLAKVTLPPAAAIGGSIAGHAIPGVGTVPGLATLGGLYYGFKAGQTMAKSVAGVADVAKQVGKEIAGTPAGAYTQLAKGTLQAAPKVLQPLAEGTAMDLGLAAAGDTPQERQGVGLGLVFGGLGAVRGTVPAARHILAGQLIGPRDFPVNAPSKSSGRYTALDAAHNTAFETMNPGQRTRANAIRLFLSKANPEADFFVVDSPEAVEKSLVASGINPSLAKLSAKQSGSTIRMPDGREAIVVQAADLAAAPHEARHAIEDVVGESKMQEFDNVIRQQYGDQFVESFGEQYSRWLLGDKASSGDWRTDILNNTGKGEIAAREKLVTELTANMAEEAKAAGKEITPEEISAYVQEFVSKRTELLTALSEGTSLESILQQMWDQHLTNTGEEIPVGTERVVRHIARDWTDVLTPQEAHEAAMSYVAREIGAENFDAWFKSHGATLEGGKQIPDRVARWIGDQMEGLGANPLAGKQSEGLKVPLVWGVAKETAAQGQKAMGNKKPVLEPESPRTPARESSDEAARGRDIVDGAPDEVMPGANQSIKEMLGNLVSAIADKVSVVVNYRSAPDQPAAGSTVEGLTQGMDRSARRAIVEAWRYLPESTRNLVERVFSPEKVRNTSKGYQVYGAAPQVVAANAQKLAEFALRNPDLRLPTEYELDPDTGSFTTIGWNNLLADVAAYSQNHSRGYTGSGERLQVPGSVTAKDYFAPPVTGEATPLAQNRADVVAALFGYHTPENATIVKAGKLPLNIVGQRVSEATTPGRLSGKKAQFGAPEQSQEQQTRAQELGITGEAIREANPFVEDLNQRPNPPSFVEAKQWMNLEHMADVTVAPEQARLEQNTLTAAAGFMPKGEASFMAKTEAGKDLEKRGFTLSRIKNETTGVMSYEATPAGAEDSVATLEIYRSKPDTAHVAFVSTGEAYKKQGIAETLYREMATDLQEQGITKLTGDVVHAAPLHIRESLFGNTRVLEGPENPRDPAYYVRRVENEIAPGVQFMPRPEEPKAIKSPAVRDKSTGKTYLGSWHVAARNEWAIEKGIITRDMLEGRSEALDKEGREIDLYTDEIDSALTDGFITNSGEFLNREQAYQRATELEQISEKVYRSKGGTPDHLESVRFENSRKFMPKAARELSKDLEQETGHSFLGEASFSVRKDEPPKKTVTAYKLLRVKKSQPGKLFPLFADADKETPVGVWLDADIGKTNMAVRPGWHFGDLPDARHIGKKGPDGKIDRQHPDTVWVEAELAADVDWQSEANARAKRNKAGEIIPKTAQIVDEIPKDGYYRYKTNPNMPGEWMISGAMKITKVLTDAEVDQILRDKGVEPLPREGGPMDLAKWGLKTGGEGEASFMAKKSKDDYKFPTGAGTFSKAWILPNGRPVQLGGKWHHDYLNENAAALKKAHGLKLRTSGQDNRTDALKAGFARVNYDKNRGELTVEARHQDWQKIKNSVLELVKTNLDSIDSMQVNLLDKEVRRVIESDGVNLFSYDKSEKLDHIPLITERTAPTVSMSAQASSEGSFAPKMTDKNIEADVEKVRAGTFEGQTYNADGTAWNPGESKNDIVTLASKNFKQEDLTTEAVREYLQPYDQLLDDPGIKMGMFPFEQDGTKMVSVDVNAVVPQEHRANSVAFAKANDQVAIFDAVKFENVETGGKGNTKLSKPGEMLDAVQSLTKGEPVNVEEIIRQNKEAAPEQEQEALPTIGAPKRALSTAEVANMTKAQLAAHYPESVIPKTRDEPIMSDIIGSPLYKQAKTRENAVKVFAKKLVEFARQYEKEPAYQDGLRWYSEFTPMLHRVYGKSAQLMAELLAATSPNTTPQQNFELANEAVVMFNKGAFKKQIAKFEEGLDMIKNNTWRPWLDAEASKGKVKLPVKVTAATFMNHWYDANDIAPRKSNGKLFGMNSQAVMKVYARQWLQNTEGPKTQNFVQNLLGTGHEATIDVWADRTMRRIGYSGFKSRWRILPKNGRAVTDPDFYFGQEAFRAAAEELGILPDALQGALWFAEKKLWADNGWGRLDLGSYQKEFSKVPTLDQKIETNMAPKTEEAPQGDLFVEPRKVKQ